MTVKFDNLLPPEKMNKMDDYELRKRRQIGLMKSLLDYGIGIMIIIAGFFLFFRDKMDLEFNEIFPPNFVDLLFGGLCVLYGSWRVYRGYKKNYFK